MVGEGVDDAIDKSGIKVTSTPETASVSKLLY